MSEPIDLDFRPVSYFPSREEAAAAAAAARRERAAHRALGALHPSLMGGGYLPERGRREVEIASVSIRSTTGDVTSLYARPGRGRILYRMVDEYEGGTITGPARWISEGPLPLGELIDRFIAAWDLIEVLRFNHDDDELPRALDFFHGSSALYPQFDDALRARVVERLGL